MPTPQPIYMFRPILKPKIWGGDAICRLKGIVRAPKCVGESWELSDMGETQSIVAWGPDRGRTLHSLVTRYGEALVGRRSIAKNGLRFPLLIKFIDANHDLSLQVHPDDEMALRNHASSGKDEMWYVIDTRPGAAIYAGFNRRLTLEDYDKMVADKSIMEAVVRHDVKPGDTFYLPSGRVHAIGGGTLLAEIQQPSDITYRIYDYDRLDSTGVPRELHTELAREAIDFEQADVRAGAISDADEMMHLVGCRHFNVSKLIVDDEVASPARPDDTFAVIMCIDGECVLDGRVTLSHGNTALIPAAAQMPAVKGRATLLIATL